MSIIRYTKDATIRYAYLNIFPDQFKTEKEKEDDSYIKNTMDYFANKAYAEYVKNRDSFVRNYDLVKGILRPEDFYLEQPQVRSFTDMLMQDLKLPSYVKHYTILTTPINEIVGEQSKRPDLYKCKAFDDESKSEELAVKSEILEKYVLNEAKKMIFEQAAMNGEEPPSMEEIEQIAFEQVKDELDSYTSTAEKWSNHILTAVKADFNIKEKSEDAMRDLLITNREYFHIYEDNSKLGFNIEVANPKNVWFLTTPDKKYTSDPSGRNQGAYASGLVQVMELSEIIESCPDLTKDEIDHLRSSLQDYGLINVRESNLGRDVTPGIDSITYDVYDPLILETRMLIESEMKENNDGLQDFLGLSSNVSAFGYKYVVVTAYWISKKKIGKVVYLDELEQEQSILVDENYIPGTIPTEISIEWGWINQWYQGKKIGPDIYHMKPLKIVDYNPIIGLNHEIKNTEGRSWVDMMKPFQVIYNICMNQMYRLMEKEIGNVASVNIRRVPRVKDGDAQDDIDIWEMEARERGIMFDDDSPENTKAPVTNQSVVRNVDLTRSNEIQTRYNLAVQIKNECWELVGMSKQRMGSISASESATGTNTAMQQSYSQTEPLFVAHEYVLRQLYQAIIDAALYTQSKKPQSTISYINSKGVSAFVQVNGSDLKFRDIKVFPTNSPADNQMFNEFRQLSQAMLQNGASIYDVSLLYTTNSVREIEKAFKKLKEQQEAMQAQAAQQKQQELDQQAQQAQATLQQNQQIHDAEIANDNLQKQLDRISKEKIATISALGFGKVEGEDINESGVPDVMETSKLAAETDKATKEYQTKMAEIASKSRSEVNKLNIEKEKINVARENMANDEKIARINAQNRGKKGGK